MINDNRKFYRKCITIPKDLVFVIDRMAKNYSYRVRNELYVELLELGILKFNENFSLKNTELWANHNSIFYLLIFWLLVLPISQSIETL